MFTLNPWKLFTHTIEKIHEVIRLTHMPPNSYKTPTEQAWENDQKQANTQAKTFSTSDKQSTAPAKEKGSSVFKDTINFANAALIWGGVKTLMAIGGAVSYLSDKSVQTSQERKEKNLEKVMGKVKAKQEKAEQKEAHVKNYAKSVESIKNGKLSDKEKTKYLAQLEKSAPKKEKPARELMLTPEGEKQMEDQNKIDEFNSLLKDNNFGKVKGAEEYFPYSEKFMPKDRYETLQEIKKSVLDAKNPEELQRYSDMAKDTMEIYQGKWKADPQGYSQGNSANFQANSTPGFIAATDKHREVFKNNPMAFESAYAKEINKPADVSKSNAKSDTLKTGLSESLKVEQKFSAKYLSPEIVEKMKSMPRGNILEREESAVECKLIIDVEKEKHRNNPEGYRNENSGNYVKNTMGKTTGEQVMRSGNDTTIGKNPKKFCNGLKSAIAGAKEKGNRPVVSELIKDVVA